LCVDKRRGPYRVIDLSRRGIGDAVDGGAMRSEGLARRMEIVESKESMGATCIFFRCRLGSTREKDGPYGLTRIACCTALESDRVDAKHAYGSRESSNRPCIVVKARVCLRSSPHPPREFTLVFKILVGSSASLPLFSKFPSEASRDDPCNPLFFACFARAAPYHRGDPISFKVKLRIRQEEPAGH
jgi:hypothetical protein